MLRCWTRIRTIDRCWSHQSKIKSNLQKFFEVHLQTVNQSFCFSAFDRWQHSLLKSSIVEKNLLQRWIHVDICISDITSSNRFFVTLLTKTIFHRSFLSKEETIGVASPEDEWEWNSFSYLTLIPTLICLVISVIVKLSQLRRQTRPNSMYN